MTDEEIDALVQRTADRTIGAVTDWVERYVGRQMTAFSENVNREVNRALAQIQEQPRVELHMNREGALRRIHRDTEGNISAIEDL